MSPRKPRPPGRRGHMPSRLPWESWTLTSLLERPPGRRPSPGLVGLSEWFNRLPTQDREQVLGAVRLAVGDAVFGMLCVLDGVRSIAELGESGTLELRYTNEDESVLINDPTGEELHDLFVGEVPPA